MRNETFKGKAYIKEGCPFSFKFLVFMAESGQLERIEIVRLSEGDATFEGVKQQLSERLGKAATFPVVEVEPERLMTDSDRLIEHYAGAHAQLDSMPVLSLYKETIFPKLIELYKLKTQGKGG